MNKNQSNLLIVVFAVVALGFILWFTGATSHRGSNNDIACTMEAMQCPDGSYVSRTGPSCTFAECPNPTPIQVEGWMTTKDSVSGVSFQYPKELQTTYIHTADWPPKIAVLDEAFSCTGAGIETMPAGRSELVTINGHQYCVTKESEGAAGSMYTNYAYATQKNGKVVISTFSLRFSQCGNYNEPQKTACDNERNAFAIDSIIDRVFGTMIIPTVVSTESGIKGTVYYGPTCPVVRNPPDGACADRPYAVSLVVRDTATQKITVSFESDAKGNFEVTLPSGTYTIEKKIGGAFPMCSGGPVTVTKGTYTSTPVYCDSGIR